jgi:hypothetical protein
MIMATLTRPATIIATDITLTHRTPVLHFCRALVEAGHADHPMTVVDTATGRPVMQVRSITAVAGVSVGEEPTTRFIKWSRILIENIPMNALAMSETAVKLDSSAADARKVFSFPGEPRRDPGRPAAASRTLLEAKAMGMRRSRR